VDSDRRVDAVRADRDTAARERVMQGVHRRRCRRAAANERGAGREIIGAGYAITASPTG
jgi:hypothetical protein